MRIFLQRDMRVSFSVYAMISFVAHLLMAVQYVCTYLITPSPPFMTVAYPYIVDLLCLSGSVCLVVTR